MRTIRAEIRMRPPGILARAWYRRLGITPPAAEGSTGPRLTHLARLVPYRIRAFHAAYAAALGYFWIPCPLCDRPFGGHEHGGTVPDPTRPPNTSLCICSDCATRRNRSDQ